MLSKQSFVLYLLFFFVTAFSGDSRALAGNNEQKKNISGFSGFDFPNPMRFGSVSSSTSNDCGFSSPENKPTKEITRENKTLKFHLKRRQETKTTTTATKNSVLDLQIRDLTRIQTLHKRVMENKKSKTKNKKQNIVSKLQKHSQNKKKNDQPGQLVATLESGMTLGSGEYFMDVLIGSPPKHFSLILDTGSDLNWIQCLPCYDCFDQNGDVYDPVASTSFKNITCNDPRCDLVSPPDHSKPCRSDNNNQSCPYYYWYGDSSNTTGDFAVETFTVNLTTNGKNSELYKVENLMFGCGHWNRGLFHGAAGLLGLGRGPLSFSSQLQSLYGHSFSYCLVDRNSDTNVSSKLIFGEDKDLLSHPNINFTSFVPGKDKDLVDTFYYLQIKSILVSGETLDIPEETWSISTDGAGGTIIDSGTTLSYFAEPAYETIKNKIAEKVKGKYPVYRDFPILDPCFNVSGGNNNNDIQLPELGIAFADGAVWNFPKENSFIWLNEDLVCLAVLGAPKTAFSIIGNYQQQNFHILYDTKKSKLGFAPRKCANV